MDQVKTALDTLVEQEGINLAMIVSRDGFIVEMQKGRDLTTDPETIGAALSTFWDHTDSMGKELTAKTGLNSIVEFQGAVVATSLIEAEDLLLAVVADPKTNPATMRYLTAKFSELLTRSL
mgnify:CR=1 FL=1